MQWKFYMKGVGLPFTTKLWFLFLLRLEISYVQVFFLHRVVVIGFSQKKKHETKKCIQLYMHVNEQLKNNRKKFQPFFCVVLVFFNILFYYIISLFWFLYSSERILVVFLSHFYLTFMNECILRLFTIKPCAFFTIKR